VPVSRKNFIHVNIHSSHINSNKESSAVESVCAHIELAEQYFSSVHPKNKVEVVETDCRFGQLRPHTRPLFRCGHRRMELFAEPCTLSSGIFLVCRCRLTANWSAGTAIIGRVTLINSSIIHSIRSFQSENHSRRVSCSFANKRRQVRLSTAK
jgi:hypothetical protein